VDQSGQRGDDLAARGARRVALLAFLAAAEQLLLGLEHHGPEVQSHKKKFPGGVSNGQANRRKANGRLVGLGSDLYSASPPVWPVWAPPSIVCSTVATVPSSATISSLTLGTKSTVYSVPRYISVCPFCRPEPRTSVTVMPVPPCSVRAFFTSSSLKCRIIASI